jgi:cytidyltransferase-like protein
MDKYARILSFAEIDALRPGLGRIVAASGGFDPLHPGHASYLIESKQYGHTLVAIVNGDDFLTRKKGRPFMDLKTRCFLVSCLREVDIVLPFEIENDPTVREALKKLRPAVFTKGGDRTDPGNIPEWPVCQELGIEVKTGVGLKKDWSSSDFLKEWGEFHMKRHGQG